MLGSVRVRHHQRDYGIFLPQCLVILKGEGLVALGLRLKNQMGLIFNRMNNINQKTRKEKQGGCS